MQPLLLTGVRKKMGRNQPWRASHPDIRLPVPFFLRVTCVFCHMFFD